MKAASLELENTTGMSALELLHTRASAVRLVAPAPDDAALSAMFKAAVRAPDHGRLRPWRFIVIRGTALERFADVLAASYRSRCPDATPEAVARERTKALRAPLIVAVAARVCAGGKIPEIEQILSAGAAAQNIMLAAHALGYGAMWKTGAPAYDPKVKSALGLAESDAIVGFLYLGTSAGGAPAGARPRAEDFVGEWHAPVQAQAGHAAPDIV
jgi:nitroreductase